MSTVDWITPAKAEAAWRERNIALCRLFLTTTMNVNEVAGHFGIAPTTVRLVLFKFGIPSKRRHAPRPSWERQRGYGRRRDQLPADLQALIEGMKGFQPTQSPASDTPASFQTLPRVMALRSR